VFTYENGNQVEQAVIDGIHLAPAPCDQPPSGAMAVGEGFFVSRWMNPHPDRKLKSVMIRIMTPETELIIPAITSELIRQKLHD